MAVAQVAQSLHGLYYDGVTMEAGKPAVRYADTEIRGGWKWQKDPSA